MDRFAFRPPKLTHLCDKDEIKPPPIAASKKVDERKAEVPDKSANTTTTMVDGVFLVR